MSDRSALWTYDDFAVGQVIELGSKPVTADEIVAFASEFDPQPMHLDEEAGRASILGGLSASGWHTCCMLMRLMCDGFLLISTSQGSPGIDRLRWRRPVLAGDTLAARSECLSTRLSQKRPGIGLVGLRHTLTNQRGEIVIEIEHTVMFRTRDAA